ncbi:MAG: hypothetical protein GWN93_06090 [Deltaproteobacteria bacterium]|nr:hypothetical protein [Deltaproteobacteria bacterium]
MSVRRLIHDKTKDFINGTGTEPDTILLTPDMAMYLAEEFRNRHDITPGKLPDKLYGMQLIVMQRGDVVVAYTGGGWDVSQ